MIFTAFAVQWHKRRSKGPPTVFSVKAKSTQHALKRIKKAPYAWTVSLNPIISYTLLGSY